MPPAAGRDGGASRNAMCLLFPLAAVLLLLSVGVTAIEEEHKSVQEQPPQEVKGFTSLSLIKCFAVVDGKMTLTRCSSWASRVVLIIYLAVFRV